MNRNPVRLWIRPVDDTSSGGGTKEGFGGETFNECMERVSPNAIQNQLPLEETGSRRHSSRPFTWLGAIADDR